MTVKCWPNYLQIEFITVLFVMVYITPCSKAREEINELYWAISNLLKAHPDGFSMLL